MTRSVLERDVREGYAEKVTLQLSLKNEQMLVSWRRRRTSIWQKEWLRNCNCSLYITGSQLGMTLPPSPWEHWQCLEIILVVAPEQGLLASSWWRSGMLLSTLQCTGEPPRQRMTWHQILRKLAPAVGELQELESTAHMIPVLSIQCLLGGSCFQVIDLDPPAL